jgi:hypothetical protein
MHLGSSLSPGPARAGLREPCRGSITRNSLSEGGQPMTDDTATTASRIGSQPPDRVRSRMTLAKRLRSVA